MTRYIFELTQLEQFVISIRLHRAGVWGEEHELAMNGRICDLEDTIDIAEWR